MSVGNAEDLAQFEEFSAEDSNSNGSPPLDSSSKGSSCSPWTISTCVDGEGGYHLPLELGVLLVSIVMIVAIVGTGLGFNMIAVDTLETAGEMIGAGEINAAEEYIVQHLRLLTHRVEQIELQLQLSDFEPSKDGVIDFFNHTMYFSWASSVMKETWILGYGLFCFYPKEGGTLAEAQAVAQRNNAGKVGRVRGPQHDLLTPSPPQKYDLGDSSIRDGDDFQYPVFVFDVLSNRRKTRDFMYSFRAEDGTNGWYSTSVTPVQEPTPLDMTLESNQQCPINQSAAHNTTKNTTLLSGISGDNSNRSSRRRTNSGRLKLNFTKAYEPNRFGYEYHKQFAMQAPVWEAPGLWTSQDLTVYHYVTFYRTFEYKGVTLMPHGWLPLTVLLDHLNLKKKTDATLMLIDGQGRVLTSTDEAANMLFEEQLKKLTSHPAAQELSSLELQQGQNHPDPFIRNAYVAVRDQIRWSSSSDKTEEEETEGGRSRRSHQLNQFVTQSEIAGENYFISGREIWNTGELKLGIIWFRKSSSLIGPLDEGRFLFGGLLLVLLVLTALLLVLLTYQSVVLPLTYVQKSLLALSQLDMNLVEAIDLQMEEELAATCCTNKNKKRGAQRDTLPHRFLVREVNLLFRSFQWVKKAMQDTLPYLPPPDAFLAASSVGSASEISETKRRLAKRKEKRRNDGNQNSGSSEDARTGSRTAEFGHSGSNESSMPPPSSTISFTPLGLPPPVQQPSATMNASSSGNTATEGAGRPPAGALANVVTNWEQYKVKNPSTNEVSIGLPPPPPPPPAPFLDPSASERNSAHTGSDRRSLPSLYYHHHDHPLAAGDGLELLSVGDNDIIRKESSRMSNNYSNNRRDAGGATILGRHGNSPGSSSSGQHNQIVSSPNIVILHLRLNDPCGSMIGSATKREISSCLQFVVGKAVKRYRGTIFHLDTSSVSAVWCSNSCSTPELKAVKAAGLALHLFHDRLPAMMDPGYLSNIRQPPVLSAAVVNGAGVVGVAGSSFKKMFVVETEAREVATHFAQMAGSQLHCPLICSERIASVMGSHIVARRVELVSLQTSFVSRRQEENSRANNSSSTTSSVHQVLIIHGTNGTADVTCVAEENDKMGYTSRGDGSLRSSSRLRNRLNKFNDWMTHGRPTSGRSQDATGNGRCTSTTTAGGGESELGSVAMATLDQSQRSSLALKADDLPAAFSDAQQQRAVKGGQQPVSAPTQGGLLSSSDHTFDGDPLYDNSYDNSVSTGDELVLLHANCSLPSVFLGTTMDQHAEYLLAFSGALNLLSRGELHLARKEYARLLKSSLSVYDSHLQRLRKIYLLDDQDLLRDHNSDDRGSDVHDGARGDDSSARASSVDEATLGDVANHERKIPIPSDGYGRGRGNPLKVVTTPNHQEKSLPSELVALFADVKTGKRTYGRAIVLGGSSYFPFED